VYGPGELDVICGGSAVPGQGESMRRRLLAAAMAYVLVGFGAMAIADVAQAAVTSPSSRSRPAPRR